MLQKREVFLAIDMVTRKEIILMQSNIIQYTIYIIYSIAAKLINFESHVDIFSSV